MDIKNTAKGCRPLRHVADGTPNVRSIRITCYKTDVLHRTTAAVVLVVSVRSGGLNCFVLVFRVPGLTFRGFCRRPRCLNGWFGDSDEIAAAVFSAVLMRVWCVRCHARCGSSCVKLQTQGERLFITIYCDQTPPPLVTFFTAVLFWCFFANMELLFSSPSCWLLAGEMK